MSKETEKGRVGSSFDDFLKEQGTYDETTEQAVKRVIASYQLTAVMKESGINKIAMAKQLKTSRSQLDRLLDPENDKVTLAAFHERLKQLSEHFALNFNKFSDL